MPKMIAYQVVEDSSSDSLDERVTGYLKEGWHLYGSHCVACAMARDPDASESKVIRLYTQAMVKYEEPDTIAIVDDARSTILHVLRTHPRQIIGNDELEQVAKQAALDLLTYGRLKGH